MSDPETLGVYAAHADRYAEFSGDALLRDPLLADFIARLPKGAQVLDLGCGPGTAAAVMAAAGLDVHATDAVPEMVALAARHPGVRAQLMTFEQITGTALYDGIWANFSLLHAAREDLPRVLDALHARLARKGPPAHRHEAWHHHGPRRHRAPVHLCHRSRAARPARRRGLYRDQIDHGPR